MKKQQKRKKKMKNRPNNRPRPRAQRPRNAGPQATPRREQEVSRLLADVTQAQELFADGHRALGLIAVMAALGQSLAPSVRDSELYRELEVKAAVMVVQGAGHLVLDDIDSFFEVYGGFDLSQRMRKHLFMTMLEDHLGALDAEEAIGVIGRLREVIRGTDDAARSGSMLLLDLLACRLFALGLSQEAEGLWENVRELLEQTGRMDGPALRLIASNCAIARWRSGKAAEALQYLEQAIELAPPGRYDSLISVYPLVCHIELLRNAGRSNDANVALEQLRRYLQVIPSVAGRSSSLTEGVELDALRRSLLDADFGAVYYRSCFPSHDKNSGLPSSWNLFYAATPRVSAIQWCTPEELLSVHGPDDELFRVALQIVCRMARFEPTFLAIQQLSRVRELLDERHSESLLIHEVVDAEREVLKRVRVTGD